MLETKEPNDRNLFLPKYFQSYLDSVSGLEFSSIGTGCCKSLNLEGFPRILGFLAASATATTKGMLRSVELLLKT